MSSTNATSVTSAATSTNTSGSGSLPNGTNYFFGFLIAFIAFLFVFLSLGLFARRRRMRLMREFLLYGGTEDDGPGIAQTEPVLWQPAYTDARGSQWSDIMVRCSMIDTGYHNDALQPLSSSLVQREELVNEKTPAEATPPRNPLTAFLGFPPSKPRRKSPQRILVTEGMNIAVMINMPQPPEARREEDEPPECQIGTLMVPWKDADLVQT
ncbi:hypothetical protein DFH07DRAFT_1054678 [Mycena maculata]|uniref:Uncharacterized protein n=1 Tax=Mycena maculata TaxID=230809 RepID=A0AAD7KH08_9AGAR|nr:hypothetical protein DFH07DRAFT_1054678 [Mycena maculata]